MPHTKRTRICTAYDLYEDGTMPFDTILRMVADDCGATMDEVKQALRDTFRISEEYTRNVHHSVMLSS